MGEGYIRSISRFSVRTYINQVPYPQRNWIFQLCAWQHLTWYIEHYWRYDLVIIGFFQKAFHLVFWWSDGKCHLIPGTDTLEMQLGEFVIESTDCEKLLGENVDSSFYKASNKLRALAKLHLTWLLKRKVFNEFFFQLPAHSITVR